MTTSAESQGRSLSREVARWVACAVVFLLVMVGGIVGYYFVADDPTMAGPTQLAITIGETEAIGRLVQVAVLTVGFLGVTATAVITYRRQQNTEERLAFEREKFEAERGDTDRRLADERAREAERSRQERYAKGAEMLGHDDAGIRIAGLNVIAQLGREVNSSDPWRQTCVNLLCANLRSTYAATGNPAKTPKATVFVGGRKRLRRISADDAAREQDQYLMVDEEACRLLPALLDDAPRQQVPPAPGPEDGHRSNHHQPSATSAESPEPADLTPLDLDLRGARLPGLDLSRKYLGHAAFSGAVFTEPVYFVGTHFRDVAQFSEPAYGAARFVKGAFFRSARFIGVAWFMSARFEWHADFDMAQFGPTVVFGGASFHKRAQFNRAQFEGLARFDAAQFHGAAEFREARFTRAAETVEGAGGRNIHTVSFRLTMFFRIPEGLSADLLLDAIINDAPHDGRLRSDTRAEE